MTTPGKLSIGKDGKLTGPAVLRYNDPWPCANHGTGSGAMMGVVMHTMDTDLPECVAWFNNPASQASAHFGIAQDGTIHQFLGVGLGLYSWAQMAGNVEWYSIEHADHGNPLNPLTPQQIVASAQVVECLSAFAGFPLQVTDSVAVKGYGVHYMGGQAWGGHSCPQDASGHGPRAGQRDAIIALAKEIRKAAAGPLPSGQYHADGTTSLAALAARQGLDVADLWWKTARLKDRPGPLERAYMDAGKWDEPMHAGLLLWLP